MQHFLLNLNSKCSSLSLRRPPAAGPLDGEDGVWVFTPEPARTEPALRLKQLRQERGQRQPRGTALPWAGMGVSG